MGSGDIEGVITQGNSSARQINTQNGHPTQILPKLGEHTYLTLGDEFVWNFSP